MQDLLLKIGCDGNRHYIDLIARNLVEFMQAAFEKYLVYELILV